MDKNPNDQPALSRSEENNSGNLVLDSGRFQAFIQPGGRLHVQSRENNPTKQIETESLPAIEDSTSSSSTDLITRGNPINKKYGMLLRRSAVSNDLPTSAQPVTDKQVLDFERNRLRLWEPQREVFIYRHAPHLAGCLSAICATIITTATRKFFFLGDSGSFVSMGFAVMWSYPPSNMFVNTFTESASLGFGRGSSLSTPAGFRSAPSLLTRVGLADYTPSPSGPPNEPSTSSAPTGSHGTCVICDQLRYVAQQVFFGFVLPTAVCPVVSMLIAGYYRTYPVPSLRNPRACLSLLRQSLSTPSATRGLSAMFALTTFGGALIAEGVRFGVERVRARDELRLLHLSSAASSPASAAALQQLLPADHEIEPEGPSDHRSDRD